MRMNQVIRNLLVLVALLPNLSFATQKATGPVVFHEVDVQLTFWEAMHGLKAGPLAVPGSTELTPNIAKIKKAVFESRKWKAVASTDYHTPYEIEHPGVFPEFKIFGSHARVGTKGPGGPDRIQEVNLYPANRRLYIPHHEVKGDQYVEVPVNLEKLKSSIVDPTKEIIIRKNGLNAYSVFANPRAEPIYKMLDPRAIFVYGVATDYCVKASVIGFLDRGYRVYVIRDAIAGITQKSVSDSNLEMLNKGATFVSTEEALQIAKSLTE